MMTEEEKTENGHGLKHIRYSDLDNKQREAYHYQKVAAILADYGFICTWQNADWHGADFNEIFEVKIHFSSPSYTQIYGSGCLNSRED